MNLTDDELRTALHSRGNRIAPPADVFTGVEARARRIHRRRVATAVAGATAAVIAIAVIVPTVVVGGNGGHPVRVGGPSPTTTSTPTPSATGQPSATGRPGGPDAAQLPAWQYRGDRAVLGTPLAAFQADWAAKHPGSTLQPLFGEVYEPSQLPELLFVASGPDGDRWGFAMQTRGGGTDFYVDQPLAADARLFVVAAPGDEVARLLAVAAPTVKAIQYAPDGSTFADMHALAPGIGIVALEGNHATDQVQVVGPDGAVLRSAPAPDLGHGSAVG